MRRLLVILLLIPLFARADWDQPFSDNEDPSVFQHVNVITGNLNLSFQDVVAQGAKPIALIRTYSSSGSLERTPENTDLLMKTLRRGWMVQGGWNLLPHVHLIIEPSHPITQYKAFLAETSGNLISYSYSHSKDKQSIILKPGQSYSQYSGRLNVRTNPQNNTLQINLETGEATLFLPDGGTRSYRGKKLNKYKIEGLGKVFYLLKTETLPSKHRLQFTYDDETNLKKIESINPAGNKVYASIDFDFLEPKKKPFQLKVTTSDRKQLQYNSILHENRQYLSEFISSCQPHEVDHYHPGRNGIGARVSSFDLAGKEQLDVSYYLPGTPGQDWITLDKVESILAPVGKNGEKVQVAKFIYFLNQTDVRDAEGLLVRYHHDGKKLQRIEYFDEKDHLQSSQKFYYAGELLCCKAMFDSKNQPLFAKTFAYLGGNVVEEVLWGCLTGNEISPLQIDPQGNPTGAESYKKTYTYYPDNLLKTESEEDGLTYEYFYKLGTDLLTTKFTKNQKNEILIREFFFYDDDNLLKCEITDNGTSLLLNDYTNVTQRIEKMVGLNADSLPEMITEFYWDPLTRSSKLLKKTKLTYLNQNVCTEEVFDSMGHSRYTLRTEYDEFGQIKLKTTPLGKENTYRRDKLGRLEECKEVGSPRKIFSYDNANRQTSCLEADSGEKTNITYDVKGRALTQTDSRGNVATHSYDCFGNRKTTTFPKTKLEGGEVYEPVAKFEYDIHGNLTSAKMPLGETTQTTYNLLRKPIQIIQADGTEIQHFYNKNGTLAKTILPDQTQVVYKYDLFQRIISKNIISAVGEIPVAETWEYNSFQFLAHINSRGLTTRYSYDGAGRKISESAENRHTTYTYDALGFLERTDNGVTFLIQKYNPEGLIYEQWQEDSEGRIENQMQFFFSDENRKEKAIRTTSQGKAIDLFTYKNGKLSTHTDPHHATTQLVYNEAFENDLGQKVLQKTTIDPHLNCTIETYDAGGRMVVLEKKDPRGQTISKEQYFYDCSGNPSKRISHVYLEGKPIRQNFVTWKYDPMGRVKEEVEADQKKTTYEYDSRGRLEYKTLPSEARLHYSYDSADRLKNLTSSDNKIHYEYIYLKGPDPREIKDHVQNTTLKRTYNLFGQIIEENQSHLQLSWDYDSVGRSKSITLPDLSTVQYTYSGGHMSAVQRKAPDESLLYQHQYKSFDENGHVAQEELIVSNIIVSSTHDLLERPATQSCSLMEHSAEYNLLGQVKTIRNSFFAEKTYEYDALHQLKAEGAQTHLFDSLGNPSEFSINPLNQIEATPLYTFTYDPNGNPKERISQAQAIKYDYDPLGRLTTITYPRSKKVQYIYDPLSRLLSKETYRHIDNTWAKQSKIFYLYDQDREIGTIDETGHLLEFKALGLGLKGDIGAAVAIELNNKVYAPLHDFGGNIIALISPEGEIEELYEMDAFGREKNLKYSKNPWRYCSKRMEEGFVFFGMRFYDPSLKRWLTPDPSGFSDSSNLYLYVLNSPLNRLDLFGLYSEDAFFTPHNVNIYVPLSQFSNMLSMQGFLCAGTIDGIAVDFYAFHTQWHKLKFSPEEITTGMVNLSDHLHELIPSKGRHFGLVSFGNGVDTTLDEFYQINQVMAKKIAGPFMLSLYNPTEGKISDLGRTGEERHGVDTPAVCRTRQFINWAADHLYKINPESFWLMIPHSENGVITRRAIEKMPFELQEIIQKNLHIFAVGPADCIPLYFAATVDNVFSKNDYVTGFGLYGIARRYLNNEDYHIKVLNCISSSPDKVLWLADHGILAPTYKMAWEDIIRQKHREIGFYGKNKPEENR